MNTRSIPSILAIVMSLIFIQTNALAHPPHCPAPDFVGTSPQINQASSMVIRGSTAFVIADNYSSLVIVDISSAPNFPILSTTPLDPPYATSITLVGNVAYISGYSLEILIYDIADPTNPVLAGVYVPVITNLGSVITHDNYMYIDSSSPNQPTEIVDISDPFNPVFVKTIELPKPIRLFHNDLAYTANMSVLDVSDPINPTVITPSTFGNTNAFGMLVVDNDLYAYEYNDTAVFDITDPIHPQLTSGFSVGRSPALIGSLVFGVDGKRINVIDISNPLSVGYLAGFGGWNDDTFDEVTDLKLIDDVFYLLANNALQAYILHTNPTVATHRTVAPANDIALKDNLALVSTDGGALQIFDITRPDRLVLISTFELDDNAVAIDIKDDVAFIATDRDDLNLINIADPSNPLFMSKIEVGRRARDVNIIDNLMYVVDRIDGLHIFDVTDPTDPQLISITDTVGWAQDITIDDENKIAYLAQNQFDLQIIDINDPTDPQIIGSITPLDVVNTGINTSSVQGNLLYTAEGESGYRIFDVSDPTNPIELATLETDEYDDTNFDYGFAHQISIDANRLVVANGTGGFSWYNNSDPFNPTLIRHLSSGNGGSPASGVSSARRIQVKDEFAYTTYYGGGLRVFDMRLCTLCPADFDNNSILDFFDISLFLSAFLAQDPAADLTNEGVFDFFDVSAFLSAFSTGCL